MMPSPEFIALPLTSATGKARVCRNTADPANSSYRIAYTSKISATIILTENYLWCIKMCIWRLTVVINDHRVKQTFRSR